MRIAFDLDETLIPRAGEFPVERSVPLAVLAPFFREPLRLGATRMLRELQASGCEVWVYTTSLRSPAYLRLWFRLLGIRVRGVVNRDRHERKARSMPYNFAPCSKYPPAEEGRIFGFEVLRVDLSDAKWAEKVLAAAGTRGPAPIRSLAKAAAWRCSRPADRIGWRPEDDHHS